MKTSQMAGAVEAIKNLSLLGPEEMAEVISDFSSQHPLECGRLRKTLILVATLDQIERKLGRSVLPLGGRRKCLRERVHAIPLP